MKIWFLIIFLTLILIIAAVPGGGCLQVKAQLPAINSFNAFPSSITAGASSTLSWNVSGATSVSIDQGIGEIALTGNRVVLPGATTIYTLKATNSAGNITATTQIIVTGVSTPVPSTGAPAINYFTASPSTITAGNSATLTWSVSNAVSVTIDHGIGAVAASASRSVYPTTGTIYTLTATNSSGSFSSTTQVFVIDSSTGPPAPLPPPPAFAVTSVTASAAPASFTGPCPTNFSCTAIITTNGAGTVTYVWENSEPKVSAVQTLTFDAAGSKGVSTGWPRDASGAYWFHVRTIAPTRRCQIKPTSRSAV
jgi:hypothetical protein